MTALGFADLLSDLRSTSNHYARQTWYSSSMNLACPLGQAGLRRGVVGEVYLLELGHDQLVDRFAATYGVPWEVIDSYTDEIGGYAQDWLEDGRVLTETSLAMVRDMVAATPTWEAS